MKKFILLMLLVIGFNLVTTAQDDKDKTKKTSTAGQKVHNTFSKHKKYSGYKTKHEHDGMKRKRKVNTKTGQVKTKITKEK